MAASPASPLYAPTLCTVAVAILNPAVAGHWPGLAAGEILTRAEEEARLYLRTVRQDGGTSQLCPPQVVRREYVLLSTYWAVLTTVLPPVPPLRDPSLLLLPKGTARRESTDGKGRERKQQGTSIRT